MLAILLMAAATMLGEVSLSVGKVAMKRKLASVYTIAFIDGFWTIAIFLAIVILVPAQRHFSIASLPILAVRIALECLLTYFVMTGLKIATRATFSFTRTMTIPLLLLVDVFLGYSLATWQIIGSLVVFGSLLFMFRHHDLNRRGLPQLLASSTLAVVTISLFKYNIAHHNSVAVEQLIDLSVASVILYLLARRTESPFHALKNRTVAMQSLVTGVGGVLGAWTFQYLPASIATTLQRAFAVIWSTVSGRVYFHEKTHFAWRVAGCALLIFGLVMLGI